MQGKRSPARYLVSGLHSLHSSNVCAERLSSWVQLYNYETGARTSPAGGNLSMVTSLDNGKSWSDVTVTP